MKRPTTARPEPALRVLHLTSVETSNYHINSLADRLLPGVRICALTLGCHGTFVTDLRARRLDAEALGTRSRLAVPMCVPRVAARLRRWQVDIVHAHMFDPALVGALATLVTRVPLVVTRHHSDAVHRLTGWRRAMHLLGERFVNARAAHLFAPSSRVREILTAWEGVPVEKVSLVPYPQERSRFAGRRDAAIVRNELGLSPGPVAITVARLHPEKGLSVLLHAFAIMPDGPQLLVVGTGLATERDRLASLAAELGLSHRIRFLGWRNDVLDLVAAADLVVHPSLHEALPSAVIEALALSRPVVATDVSGVRDILGDPPAGRIVPPGDAPALAEAIRATVAALAAARHIAEGGRERLFEWMDPQRVAEEHLRCYRAVARRQQPRGL